MSDEWVVMCLILAISAIISFGVLFGYHYWFGIRVERRFEREHPGYKRWKANR